MVEFKNLIGGISIVGLVLTIANLTGGLAYFSDANFSENHRLQAGQLQLNVVGGPIIENIEIDDSGLEYFSLHVFDNPAWVHMEMGEVTDEESISDYLELAISLNQESKWNGSVSDFPETLELGEFENCTIYDLEIAWILSGDSEEEGYLLFDMVFTAFQTRHGLDLGSSFNAVSEVTGNQFWVSNLEDQHLIVEDIGLPTRLSTTGTGKFIAQLSLPKGSNIVEDTVEIHYGDKSIEAEGLAGPRNVMFDRTSLIEILDGETGYLEFKVTGLVELEELGMVSFEGTGTMNVFVPGQGK